MVDVRRSNLVAERGHKRREVNRPVKKYIRPEVEVVEIHPSPLPIQDLASKIYFDLPRELRDRIYTFIVQGPYDNNVIVRPQRSTCSKPPFTLLVRQSTGSHSYQWIEDPTTLFFNKDHVGPDVARELLESYYWTRTFKFSYHMPGLLRTFLESDGFGLGMRPGDYVRRMTMQVQPFVDEMETAVEDWEGWRLQVEFPKLVFC